MESLEEIEKLREPFMKKVELKESLQKQAMEAHTEGYAGIEEGWLAYKNEEVLEHYPPRYIVG